MTSALVANLGSRSEERADEVSAARWSVTGPLHDGRDRDAHDRQRGDEFAADYRHGRQQELFSFFVGLAEDGMAVVESVEELCQLEDVFGKICGLGGGDAFVDDVRGLRGGEP
jgi:hypothetical protein